MLRFFARSCGFVLLVLGGVAACSAPASAQDRRQPNVLLILADDMGYGDLSCYGSRQIQTPNIDAIAQRGVRFTQAYVSMMVCAPSRAGLMTGRYQNRFGFEHNIVGAPEYYPREQIGLPITETTMADRLGELGYATACIGKWHLGSTDEMHPNSRGFDYYFGRYRGHGYFPRVEDQSIYRQREPVDSIDVPYTTDWYTQEAIGFIEQVEEGQPWFVYLAHDTPHTPLQAKEEDLQRFAHIRDNRRRTYCAMQYCLDVNVGQVMDYLETSGQLDNTIVVFLSDNGGTTGGSINAPLRGQKGMFLEGGLHVPMIVSWPGVLPQGATYEQPVIALDLLPTFVEAAGGSLNEDDEIDGVDLLPYLQGERGDERPHDVLYFRMVLRGAAIRVGDWKLVRTGFMPPMLYDLSRDIAEQHDLAQRHPERVRDMMMQLSRWEQSLPDTPRWFSSNRWISSAWRTYTKDYQLTQP